MGLRSKTIYTSARSKTAENLRNGQVQVSLESGWQPRSNEPKVDVILKVVSIYGPTQNCLMDDGR